MNKLHLTLFALLLVATIGAGARAEDIPSAESSSLPFMAIASSSLSSTDSVLVQPSANPDAEAAKEKVLADALTSWKNLAQFLVGVPAGIVVDIPFLPTPTPVPSTTPTPSPVTAPPDTRVLNLSITTFRKAQQALYTHSYQEAMLEINRAIEKMPNIALFHALKGSIFYSVGDYSAARTAWSRSLTLDSTVPLVREMLERIADNGEKKR